MKLVNGAIAASFALVSYSAFAEPPTPAPTLPATETSVSTVVDETPTAVIAQRVEVIEPVSTRPAVDPENPIAPEVAALVASKPNYTTADISMAQRDAMIATPASVPTTTITTTLTTPKPTE